MEDALSEHSAFFYGKYSVLHPVIVIYQPVLINDVLCSYKSKMKTISLKDNTWSQPFPSRMKIIHIQFKKKLKDTNNILLSLNSSSVINEVEFSLQKWTTWKCSQDISGNHEMGWWKPALVMYAIHPKDFIILTRLEGHEKIKVSSTCYTSLWR